MHSLVWSRVLDLVRSVKSVFGEDKVVTKDLNKFLMELICVTVKDLG